MNSPWHMLGAALTAGIVTFALRALPFGITSLLKESKLIARLSQWIPLGAMVLLSLYALYSIDSSSLDTSLPYIAGAATTVIFHLWKKNMILSMVSGTFICVILANLVF